MSTCGPICLLTLLSFSVGFSGLLLPFGLCCLLSSSQKYTVTVGRSCLFSLFWIPDFFRPPPSSFIFNLAIFLVMLFDRSLSRFPPVLPVNRRKSPVFVHLMVPTNQFSRRDTFPSFPSAECNQIFFVFAETKRPCGKASTFSPIVWLHPHNVAHPCRPLVQPDDVQRLLVWDLFLGFILEFAEKSAGRFLKFARPK